MPTDTDRRLQAEQVQAEMTKSNRENRKKGMRARMRMVILAAAAFAVSLLLPLHEPAMAAEGYENVAGSSEMSAMKEVGSYGMTPISGESVKDGRYDVRVESSSSFFRIKECGLTVKKGRMSAVITIDSTSYKCVFMGAAKEAAVAEEEEYIFPKEKGGQSYFTIPVEALNKPLACAAFSKKEKQWYDRNILIDASSLPEEALEFKLPDYELIGKAVDQYEKNGGRDREKESAGSEGTGSGEESGSGEQTADKVNAAIPADIAMDDGTYSIEVNMTGGSGRASVSSPTWFYVRNGKAYAKLLWSSSHYDYMKLVGIKYGNESTDGGNSTFTIPVAAFDQPIKVIADTTAMGDPVEIEYELTFYQDTIDSVTKVPQEAAKKVICIALIIIVVGGILNIFLKRKRKQ